MVNTDTDSLTNSKTNQSSKNDSKQLYIENVKNDDINNRFMICHQNIRGLKSKINEFLLSLPIYARFLDHITTNPILVNEQYGFGTWYSNEQASFSLINNILTAMINNLKIGGIFCDLQKAFGCVNHKIL